MKAGGVKARIQGAQGSFLVPGVSQEAVGAAAIFGLDVV
jgi:hypothetical protein